MLRSPEFQTDTVQSEENARTYAQNVAMRVVVALAAVSTFCGVNGFKLAFPSHNDCAARVEVNDAVSLSLSLSLSLLTLSCAIYYYTLRYTRTRVVVHTDS